MVCSGADGSARPQQPPSALDCLFEMEEYTAMRYVFVLCCLVLCCAVLCCVVLCCVLLSCAVLCCVVLCCVLLCCDGRSCRGVAWRGGLPLLIFSVPSYNVSCSRLLCLSSGGLCLLLCSHANTCKIQRVVLRARPRPPSFSLSLSLGCYTLVPCFVVQDDRHVPRGPRDRGRQAAERDGQEAGRPLR